MSDFSRHDRTTSKSDMARGLSHHLGLTRGESGEIVSQFFEIIRRCLLERRDVKISGFGNFVVRNKTARPGRNPKTGEEVTIPPRTVVVFRASQKLRERVKGHAPAAIPGRTRR